MVPIDFGQTGMRQLFDLGYQLGNGEYGWLRTSSHLEPDEAFKKYSTTNHTSALQTCRTPLIVFRVCCRRFITLGQRLDSSIL